MYAIREDGSVLNNNIREIECKSPAPRIVFFKIKPELDQETAKREIADSLKDVPGPIKPMQFSAPISEARTKGLNFGFVSYFKDRYTLREYDVSEAHQRAVNDTIKPRIADFLDYDIEVPDGAAL
ncbi:Dabb domain-containing protein [Ceratobasidium sp. AG-Ba]|nr:Dabb domain-containing protein [Ceratobasidium sp. AG-Ba]